MFDFFLTAIVPMLLSYDIDFQYVLDKTIQCSSCKKSISATQRTWDYLLVDQTTNEEAIDNIMADLFGPVLYMQLSYLFKKRPSSYINVNIKLSETYVSSI